MKKRFPGTCFLVLVFQIWMLTGYGQSILTLKEGKILYERKINSYGLMKQMTEDGGLTKEKLDAYKSNNPAFSTSRFILQFKGNRTLYQSEKNGVAAAASIDEWFSMVANDNIVYADLDHQQIIVQKSIFGNVFNIADSLRKIKWKITSEVRNIAGFQCRRANAVMMDSIYIVAFYTNEILPAGGPESFVGLPGMILGLALPHEHITWFAQEVYTTEVPGLKCPIPDTKSKVDNQKFTERLMDITKGWGGIAPLVMRKALL